jgi:hypothetical protein
VQDIEGYPKNKTIDVIYKCVYSYEGRRIIEAVAKGAMVCIRKD